MEMFDQVMQAFAVVTYSGRDQTCFYCECFNGQVWRFAIQTSLVPEECRRPGRSVVLEFLRDGGPIKVRLAEKRSEESNIPTALFFREPERLNLIDWSKCDD